MPQDRGFVEHEGLTRSSQEFQRAARGSQANENSGRTRRIRRGASRNGTRFGKMNGQTSPDRFQACCDREMADHPQIAWSSP